MSQNAKCSSSAPNQSTPLVSGTIDHSEKPISFQLPPAIDFDAYRTPANKSEHLAGKSASDPGSRKKTSPRNPDSACDNTHGLKTSRESSHSSLKSLQEHSLHVHEKISEEDYVELGKYVALFNTTKK